MQNGDYSEFSFVGGTLQGSVWREKGRVAMAHPRTVLISFANPVFSMGVNALSAALQREGFDVSTIYFLARIRLFQQFESFSERDYAEIGAKCAELRPQIVGISVSSNFYVQAVRVTQEIRRSCEALVVWGGIHPTIDPEGSLEHADVICRGEGDRAIVDLARAVRDQTSMEGIENLWIRRNGTTVHNKTVLLEDLDSLPFPQSDLKDRYVLREGRILPLQRQFRFHSLMTSRGCHYSCSYCSVGNLRKVYENYRVRRRSVGNVLEELRLTVAQNPGIQKLYFYDDVFTFDVKWMKDFAVRYKNEINLPFFCYTHPNCVKEEMICLLKEMGCTLISMGIQGSSARIRQIYNRRTSTEQLIRACNIISKYKFDGFYIDMIFSPFDSLSDWEEGMELLLRLHKPFYVAMHTMAFFPKAAVTERALEAGLIREEDVVSHAKRPFHQMSYSIGRLFRRSGKWWSLYALCGKVEIPNFILRLAKVLPGLAQLMYLCSKLIERIQLRLTGRNAFAE